MCIRDRHETELAQLKQTHTRQCGDVVSHTQLTVDQNTEVGHSTLENLTLVGLADSRSSSDVDRLSSCCLVPSQIS